jgi:short subunit dehydrogenase-like uncharacterized protein
MALSDAAAEFQVENCTSAAQEVRQFPLWLTGIFAGHCWSGRMTARAVLNTVNGYTFTSMAAAEAARRVLGGEMKSGFQTPVELFGKGFAETIAHTKVTVL